MALFDSIKQFFSVGKKKDELPLTNIGPLVVPTSVSNAVTNFGKSVLQSTIRSVPELGMTAIESLTPKETFKPIEVPKNPVAQFLLGSEPLKTTQQKTAEVSQEFNLPKQVVAPVLFAGSVLDLPPFGVGKKVATETLELAGKQAIKKLGKNVEKEGSSFLVEEFSKLAKPTKELLDKLLTNKTVETATHTISYDPSTKLIDIIPKVSKEVKTAPVVEQVAKTVGPKIKQVEEFKPRNTGIKIPKPKDIFLGTKKTEGVLPQAEVPNVILTESGKRIKPTAKFGNTKLDKVVQTKAGFDQLMDEADDVLADTFGASKVKKKVADVLGPEMVGNLIGDIPQIKNKGAFSLTTSFLNRALEKVGGFGTLVTTHLKQALYDPTRIAGVRFADDMGAYAKRINDAFKGIKLGGQLDSAVMRYGEKYGAGIVSNPDAILELSNELKNSGLQSSVGKVVNAIVESRKVYDELLSRINTELVRFGYTEMPSLPNYFTHIAELTDVNGKFYPALRNLETSMAGINFNTKPAKSFAQFALKRKGPEAEVQSALAGLKRYLPVALQQVHYMEPIQRFRATAQLLRQQVQNNPAVSPSHLSEFVGWLDTMASSMAGKNIGAYKLIEQSLGRIPAEILKTMDSMTGLNLMAYNVGASLSNLAVITNALARTGIDSFTKAVAGAVRNTGGLNEVNGIKSDFLSGRYFEKIAGKNFVEKVGDVGMKLFEVIDRFASETVLRSFYDDFIKKGMSPVDAMRSADQLAMEQIGNRMIGMSPTIIKQWPVISKFSLEPMNYIDTIIHDIPRDYQGKAIEGAWLLSKIILLNYVANEMYQQATGRRILPDPIYAGQDIKRIWDEPSDTGQKIVDTIPIISKEIPLVQTFTGGGRVPILAGLPDINTVTDDPVAALLKLSTLVNPFGGSQEAYKVYTASKDYSKGYAEDRQGRIKYPVAESVPNLLRIPMGKYAFPEATTYYREGLTPLGTDESTLIKNIPRDKQQPVYGLSQVLRKIDQPASDIRGIFTKLERMVVDPNISREEKLKYFNSIGSRIKELQQYYPKEIARFAKVMGVDITGKQPPVTSPQPLGQTITTSPSVFPTLKLSVSSVGKGGKVTPKKVSIKKTPMVKLSFPTRKTPVSKGGVMPKLPTSKRTSVSRKGVKVSYRKPTISGLRVKV